MAFKSAKVLQLIFLLLISQNVYSQTYSSESMKSSMLGSLGWGVVVCIIALIIGVLLCLLGLSTVIPGVFIAIGFCIPLFFFIFFSFCPMEEVNYDFRKNENWNVFIVWRWLYFSVMLVMLFALFAPLWILWNVTIMPQRVDSRAQKKHDENYQAFLKEERKKAEAELNKQQLGEVLELNQNPNQNNLQINGNHNVGGYNQQPIQMYDSLLPVSSSKNEADKKKFSTLKRKTHQPEEGPK